MKLRWMAVGLALAAAVAGCSRAGDGAGGGSQAEPQVAQDRAAAATKDAGAPAGKGSAAAAEVRLVDLGNRIVRTARVDLEVGKGTLDETIDRATDVVTRAEGTYVGSSTSVPGEGPATGEVTFRVPVDAFEAILRELKGLGTYRGEQSDTEDVTNQYVDLRGQLTAWRAQERVYLRLLGRARSIGETGEAGTGRGAAAPGGSAGAAGVAAGGWLSRRCRRSVTDCSCFWSCSISLRSVAASCAAAAAGARTEHIKTITWANARMTILRGRVVVFRSADVSRGTTGR